jgi:hypothetical protein
MLSSMLCVAQLRGRFLERTRPATDDKAFRIQRPFLRWNHEVESLRLLGVSIVSW